jgi:hypothetical protein
MNITLYVGGSGLVTLLISAALHHRLQYQGRHRHDH